ncbi:MAG: amino acid dehydrogenase, partial [Pseudomonadales bacterium]|nr:amino acid dehydrogenase [Pseudomonadales bacterium]
MLISEIDVSRFDDFDRHEKVPQCVDEESGLNAFIALHNRNLGPALGGCRYWSYPSEEAAIKDVLRLSRGMTYKSAIAELALGGGKAVIIGTPEKKHAGLYRAMGRFIESLEGAYIT